MSKGKIIKMGTFDEEGKPTGWEFDCCGGKATEITPEGEELIADYTIAELHDIYNKVKDDTRGGRSDW